MHRQRFVAVALLTMTSTVAAVAQDTSTTAGRLNCVSASQIVARSHHQSLLADAYSVLIRCPGAAATLAQVWNTPPSDSSTLAKLTRRSAGIADRRILAAKLPIVSNGLFNPSIRRAALEVVIAQYDPSYVISSSTWSDPEHTSVARDSDYYQKSGEEPVTAIERQAIIDGLRRMAASDSDDRLRRVATRLLNDLPAQH